MNQKERILEALQTGEWFSLGDALNMSPPIYRLSERIRELRAEGYQIESQRVHGKTYQEYRIKPLAPAIQEKIALINSIPARKEQKDYLL